MIKKTPPILTRWNFEDYFNEFNIYYKWVKIFYPETKEEVCIYTWNEKEVNHYICWSKSSQINYARAQKLLWIKFLIENVDLRDVFLENETQNILFVSQELNYIVVVSNSVRSNNSLLRIRRVITMYVKNTVEIQKMYSDSRYKILCK